MAELGQRVEQMAKRTADLKQEKQQRKLARDQALRESMPAGFAFLDSLESYKQPGRLLEGAKVLMLESDGRKILARGYRED